MCPETRCVDLRHLESRRPGSGLACRNQRINGVAVQVQLDKGIDPRRAVDRLGKRNSDDRTAALKVSPFVGERVINHRKDVLEETYDLWDYFDEKRDALERLENYLLRVRAVANQRMALLSTRARPSRRL
jgi:hypothetical protein